MGLRWLRQFAILIWPMLLGTTAVADDGWRDVFELSCNAPQAPKPTCPDDKTTLSKNLLALRDFKKLALEAEERRAWLRKRVSQEIAQSKIVSQKMRDFSEEVSRTGIPVKFRSQVEGLLTAKTEIASLQKKIEICGASHCGAQWQDELHKKLNLYRATLAAHLTEAPYLDRIFNEITPTLADDDTKLRKALRRAFLEEAAAEDSRQLRLEKELKSPSLTPLSGPRLTLQIDDEEWLDSPEVIAAATQHFTAIEFADPQEGPVACSIAREVAHRQTVGVWKRRALDVATTGMMFISGAGVVAAGTRAARWLELLGLDRFAGTAATAMVSATAASVGTEALDLRQASAVCDSLRSRLSAEASAANFDRLKNCERDMSSRLLSLASVGVVAMPGITVATGAAASTAKAIERVGAAAASRAEIHGAREIIAPARESGKIFGRGPTGSRAVEEIVSHEVGTGLQMNKAVSAAGDRLFAANGPAVVMFRTRDEGRFVIADLSRKDELVEQEWHDLPNRFWPQVEKSFTRASERETLPLNKNEIASLLAGAKANEPRTKLIVNLDEKGEVMSGMAAVTSRGKEDKLPVEKLTGIVADRSNGQVLELKNLVHNPNTPSLGTVEMIDLTLKALARDVTLGRVYIHTARRPHMRLYKGMSDLVKDSQWVDPTGRDVVLYIDMAEVRSVLQEGGSLMSNRYLNKLPPSAAEKGSF